LVIRESDNNAPPAAGGELGTGGLLSRNLARLGTSSRVVRERLEEVEARDVEVTVAADGAQAIRLPDGTRLCSQHQPLDEARRMLESFDPAEAACAVVLGFGAGHHVERVLDLFKGTGLVVVFEPDLPLLKAVLSHVDCTRWLDPERVVFIDDETDRAGILGVLSRFETQLVAGTRILEHPPSKQRLGDRAGRMASMVTDAVSTARMSMSTLLMRSAGTVRNELLNIDHYALGPGIGPFADCARGQLGVVVSAGPSLRRNIDLLAEEGVRDRCVIIAAQTTLRPLLDAGIRPHFVTALDYHHISKRFYEGLTPEQIRDTTLIALPQAHPVIADSWPGPIAWARGMVLEKVLGGRSTANPALPSASTVAHLSYLFARHLGCDPVALIGQDLGFTDGVYYARGTAIDDVWTPELNPFNTIAKMEWERIVRHRGMLHRLKDHNGRSILTDEQMLTYLRRFESLFRADAERGLLTIDASEGGALKSHTEVIPLSEALDRHATDRNVDFTELLDPVDETRRDPVLREIIEFRAGVERLGEASRKTKTLLRRLMEVVEDPVLSEPVFTEIEKQRLHVESLGEVFAFVDRVNQLGAFKRYLADRRIDLHDSAEPVEIQLRQIRRDMVNVELLDQASEEAGTILDDAIRLLDPDASPPEPVTSSGPVAQESIDCIEGGEAATGPVVALVPVDPRRGGSGCTRSLREEFADRNVLQRTLERIGRSRLLERILLLVPDDFDVDAVVDRRRVNLPIEIVTCGESPFGPEHEAVRAARMFSDQCWRGGIAGMTAFDEVLCARSMHEALVTRDIAAAVLCGPDWPLVEVLGAGGVDELIVRWRESAGRQSFVFTQAPPGLGACLLGRDLLARLVPVNRLATIGAMIGYRPERPEHDPIAREGNVTIEPRVRRSQVRAVFDSPRQLEDIRRALEPMVYERDEIIGQELDSGDVVDQLELIRGHGTPQATPRHLLIELCTGRLGSGPCSPHWNGSVQREPMNRRRFARILAEITETDDTLLTLGGAGDPLQHPHCLEFIDMAFAAGIRGIHVRTELQCSSDKVKSLARSGVQVISVDVNADRPETYRSAMGHDGFAIVIENMKTLIDERSEISGAGPAAMSLPWIVPRIQRRVETYEDIEGFYERWQRLLGTAVIDPTPPVGPGEDLPGDPLADASNTARHMSMELQQRMVVLSDGAVPVSEVDLMGRQVVGSVDDRPLVELWRQVVSHRRQILRDEGENAYRMRTYYP